ncbi:MAG: S8 family serine peptidase [Candidatus Aureabacteria bacterium]|nr:S8 family serine peptidase [Candidatus Auribacterota bacterium]
MKVFTLALAFSVIAITLSLTHTGTAVPGTYAGASHKILLKSSSLIPLAKNAADVKALAARGEALLKSGRSRIHALLQLHEIPGLPERNALARQGVALLTYIPNRAWLASIPAAASQRVTSLPEVRWVGDLSADDKLHPRIRNGEFGEWAYDKNTGVAVVLVQLFRDVGLEEGIKVAAGHGGVVLSEASLINTLVVKIAASKLMSLAGEDIVEWIEQPLPPLVPINAENRAIVGADTLQGVPYSLDGTGVDVLVYDGGRVYAHPDLDSHRTWGDAAPFAEHATHVACTVCGDGTVTYNNCGMAPKANLLSMGFEDDGTGVFLYTNPGDIQADLNYAKNTWPPSADLLNASIGTNTAWNGFPCSYEGNYGPTSQLLDTIARGSLGEPFIMAWAAGNERGGACGSSYNTTAPPAGAKNPIQSGATTESDGMSTFSSWGPTDDGRLKPVICSPGVNVLSCDDAGGYTTMSGTSMASPTTAGIIALMLQQYRVSYATAGEFLPSSAKALLMHTALDLGNAGPDFQFGYGRINGVNAVDAIIARDLKEEQLSDQNELHEYTITVAPGTLDLRASLAWDDAAGSNVTIKKLVNDLDLTLVGPDSTVYYPWILDPSNPSAAATQGEDTFNNQEQVVVQNPAEGSWKVCVRARELTDAPQSYSVVFPGAGDLSPSTTPGVTPTPTVTPDYCYEAITNGGFESGTSPWSFSGSATRTTEQAHSGSYSARLGGTTNGRVYQQLVIPLNTVTATLDFWVRMNTSEIDPYYDFFDVEVKDASDQTLVTLLSICNNDPGFQNTWVQETFVLGSDFAGRTVRLNLQADVDASVNTYFYIDDV